MIFYKNNGQQFAEAQIEEIQKYVKQYPNENQNHVILRWIDLYAEDFSLIMEAGRITDDGICVMASS